MASDGTLVFDTSLDTDGLQKGTSGLGDIAKNALGVFAGNLMTKATEAVVNLGKEALSSGMSFETSMHKVQTLFTGTDEQFSALNDEILKISSSTGLAADGLAEAAYSAESAGVPMEQLGTMLESSAHLAAAGFTDIDTALSATAKTMNAYGMEGEESIGKVQKVLMQTQNLGITTVDELGASLAQVTPTAAAFGVSFEQVGASLAVMTAAGTPTAQATTQLNSLIAELGKNGTVASKNLAMAAEGTKYAGMSFNEIIDSGADLSEVLGMLSDQADKDGVSMVDMFSSIEAGKAALSIFSGEGETFKSNLEQMGTSADVVGEAYDTMSDTLEHKTERIKTSFQNMAIGIFQTAAGPLADGAEAAANALGRMTDAFNDGGLQGLGDVIVDMMNEAADTLANFDWEGAADAVVQKITDFIDGDGAGKFLESATNIVVNLADGLGRALPKLIPAVVKLIAHIVTNLIKQAPKLINAAYQLIANLAVGLVQALPDIAAAIWQVLGAIVDAIAQLPGIIAAYYDTLLTGIGGWLADMGTQAGEGMADMVNTIVSWISQLPDKFWTWLTNTVTKLLAWGQNMVTNAGTAMSNMLSTIVNWVKQLPGKLWEFFLQACYKTTYWGVTMVLRAGEAMSNMLSKVIEWVSQLPDKVWTWLVNTVTKVVTWGGNMVSNASTAMSNMINAIINWVKQLPDKVWTWLTNTAQKVVQFGNDLKTKGAAAAKGLFDAVVDGVKSLPEKMKEIGSNIVSGIWEGISGGWDWLKGKVSEVASSLLQGAKDALGIHSPSREFANEVGRFIPPGMAKGVDKAMPSALKDMKAQAADMVEGMRAAVTANAGSFSVRAAGSAGRLALAGGGTTVYNDYHTEQENTYNVPVATPSEVAKTQREALRKMVGGVK